MVRLTEHACDFCGAESLEWYQTVCHGCGEAFCRACAAIWPGYCCNCEGPDDAPDDGCDGEPADDAPETPTRSA